MESLEVGQYVRTKKSGIQKIYEIDENKTKWKYLYKLKTQDGDGFVDLGVLCEDDVLKASHNIIDLIEVGDVLKINEIMDNNTAILGLIDDLDIFEQLIEKISNGEIQLLEVLTHEQFESMSYKVGK